MHYRFISRDGRKRISATVVLVVAVLNTYLVNLAIADNAPPDRAIFFYQGKDRAQRVLAGAKKEGAINLYCVMGLEQMNPIAQAFEKKYGIKVNLWRSSSENVLQRAITESQGGRFDADVLEIGGPELEALHREKLLQQIKSPYFQELIPQAIPPHQEWVGSRINVFVHAYNTAKVKKEELPKTYEDLLDPKWKGRLGVEAANLDWFSTLVRELGEEKGLRLFKDMVAANGLSVRKGHPVLVSLVASGEIPLALATYSYFVDKLKKEKAAPIDWFVMAPAIVRVTGVGVAKKAPHPYAALLFYDFMLSAAQPLLLEFGITPANKKLNAYFNSLPMKFVDVAAFLDEQTKWTQLYDQIVVNGAK